MTSSRRVTITYPPDYDGELWITLTDAGEFQGQRTAVKIEVTLSAKPETTDLELLESLATDLMGLIRRRRRA